MGSFESDGKAIMGIFIGALIAVVFLASIADSVFLQTNELSVTNFSQTTAAVNASVVLKGRSFTGTPGVTNSSFDDVTAQYSFNNTILNGADHQILMVTLDEANLNSGASTLVNVTYSFQPDGYLADSGSRSMALLIVIFGAVAIIVFIFVVMIKDGSLGNLIKRG